ncbi:hypothetical protein N865_11270 [Intrasporangium oryzae NRRL B-24470]|uniref:Acetyl-CoA carboxylase n=1 Tax=Intrasporangium oryzae NRRL B-24470 TaxID=1386089 RepID=W9GB77_9MICO|nr:acyl-CoA carboxylase subunit epsilon [Intrasporangium oryzae]EWT01104.1 hypothetical protein N865_11270 [Intrasporangium oryzae NRRL B-24470]
MSADQSTAADPAPPAIRVVTGSPTAEEVAALVAVLSAVGGAPEEHDTHPSAWSDPSWRLLGPSRTTGGWRASGLPR